MRIFSWFISAAMLATIATHVHAQGMRDREREFLQSKPLIGEALPNVEIFSADGSPFKTADLRGHYTVLTFGCLT